MKNWFEDWFRSGFYSQVYSHRDQTEAEQIKKLILNTTQLNQGSNILDAACGAGRHSISFAKEGFKVTGFDLSYPLLREAQFEKRYSGCTVDFFNADIRKVAFRSAFDLVLNIFTSFGYFEDDDQNFAFPRNIRKNLKESSFYVLDFFNRNYLINSLNPKTERESGGFRIIEERRIEDGRVIKNIRIGHDENEYNFIESVRLFEPSEIISAFEKCGYCVRFTFGNYFGEKFNHIDSQRFIAFFSPV